MLQRRGKPKCPKGRGGSAGSNLPFLGQLRGLSNHQ